MAVTNLKPPVPHRPGRRTLRALLLLPLAAALLVSCSVRGAQMSQNSLLERFERKSGLIAFIALDGNISTADQTGGRLTQLTADAGSREGVRRWYSSPTWSARGRRLAFVRFDQQTDGSLDAAILTSDSGSRQSTGGLGERRARTGLPVLVPGQPLDQRAVPAHRGGRHGARPDGSSRAS